MKKISLIPENVKHFISENTKLIDIMREKCLPIFNVNILMNKLKILNIYNQGQKLNHRLYNISLGKNLQKDLLEMVSVIISDLISIKNNRSFSLSPRSDNFQNSLLETFKNYNPDLLFSVIPKY